MCVLVVEPELKPEVREIDDSLKAMQEIVGGLIQLIYPVEDSVALVCNDEGKLMNLPMNRALRDENGQIFDIVFGIPRKCFGTWMAGLSACQVNKSGKESLFFPC